MSKTTQQPVTVPGIPGKSPPLALSLQIGIQPGLSVGPADNIAKGIYSPVVESGHLVYVAGTCGVDKDGKFVKGTIKDRTAAIFERLKDKLAPSGLDLSDLVSVQIFLSHHDRDFRDMNEAYFKALEGVQELPVRTCVGVAALPLGTDIEMTVIAAKRDFAIEEYLD